MMPRPLDVAPARHRVVPLGEVRVSTLSIGTKRMPGNLLKRIISVRRVLQAAVGALLYLAIVQWQVACVSAAVLRSAQPLDRISSIS